jgi:hypothetical protein
MKQLFLSVTVLLSSLIISAQQQFNDPNAEKRTVESFHGIEVQTGIELVLTAGTTEELAVSAATAEFRDKIVTKVQDGILKIYYESKLGSVNKRKETKNLKAWVSYKTLDILKANTGAEVKINGVLKSASLKVDANTGAEIKGEVNIDDLKVSQNTGSRINLTGKATKLSVDGDTGSKFVADEMTTSDCSVKVSTGAQASVRAETALEAKASTGGVVRYKGNATIREIKTNTGGIVNKVNGTK